MTDTPWQPRQAGPEPDVPTAPVWLPGAGDRARPDEPRSVDAGPVRPHRVAVVVLSVLLVAVVAVAAVLTWDLVRVNTAWQQHSQEWQALAEQHGADLAQTRSDLEETRTELAAVQDQLTTAQNRITQLADEKARLGDESAAQQQLTDYQARVSAAAGQVATALATCIDGQEKLIGYIENPAAYDPASLASYRQDVEGYCSDARNANATLQAELKQ